MQDVAVGRPAAVLVAVVVQVAVREVLQVLVVGCFGDFLPAAFFFGVDLLLVFVGFAFFLGLLLVRLLLRGFIDSLRQLRDRSVMVDSSPD